jgi:hypothetical protein
MRAFILSGGVFLRLRRVYSLFTIDQSKIPAKKYTDFLLDNIACSLL